MEQWCGNESDAILLTPKYRLNHKSFDTAQNAVFLHFYFWNLYNIINAKQYDATFFYPMPTSTTKFAYVFSFH